MEGNLIRKIKKDYNPVKISAEDKREKERQREEMKKRGVPPPPVELYFPDYWPSFHHLFADEQGRLFVMTYEKGENSREFIYDVFSPQGIFLGKINLPNYGGINNPLPIKAKHNHLYLIRKKENDYHDLVVYRMIWGSH